MKNVKKSVALVLAAVLSLSLLAACGGPNVSPPAAAPASGAPQGAANTQPAADGQVYDLVFTTHTTPTAAYADALQAWVDSINEESGGRLNITIYFGGTLAAGPDEAALVQQGGADICWSTTSLSSSVCPLSNILGAFSAEITNTYMATYVWSKMYQELDPIRNAFEDSGLVLLSINGQTPSSLGGVGKKIVEPGDFSGVSMQCLSSNTVKVSSAMKAASLNVSIADLYENFAKHVCSAALIDGALYNSRNLYEQIDWFCDHNFNISLAFLAMNKEKLESLPADLQALLLSKFDDLAYAMSEAINEDFKDFVSNVLHDHDVEVYSLSDTCVAELDAVCESTIVEDFRNMCAEKGYDADGMLAQIEGWVTEARDLYGAEYDWFNN